MTDYNILLKYYDKAKKGLKELEDEKDWETNVHSILYFKGKIKALKEVIDEIKGGGK